MEKKKNMIKGSRRLNDILKIKKALLLCCSYKSQLPLIEIGRENLADDIDKEVMPLIHALIKEERGKLKE